MKKFIKSITVALSIGVLSAGLATTSFAGLKVVELKTQNNETGMAQNSGTYGQTSRIEHQNDGTESKSDGYAEQSTRQYEHNKDSYNSDSRPHDYAAPAQSCSDSVTHQAKLDVPPSCSLDL